MTKLIQAIHTLAEEFRSAVELIAERDTDLPDPPPTSSATTEATHPSEEAPCSYTWQSPWS